MPSSTRPYWLLIALLVPLSLSPPAQAQGRHTLSGFVQEQGSRETLIGVNVLVEGTTIGTATNSYGFYSLTLSTPDSVSVVFSSVGFQPRAFRVKLEADLALNVALDPTLELEGVVVVGEMSKASSRSPYMSVVEVPIQMVRSLPSLLGERDPLKVIQLMPGVQKGSEGSSGLYVRGGGPDQNLIILDGAPVYNAFHLFGFFSVFNADAIKSMELTKGGFPARFGGRLSSVLEITLRDGNMEEFRGEGSVGILSSRLMLEGPIVPERASFLVSGRRTYFDLLLYPLMRNAPFSGGYFFHDFTAKANWKIDPRNRLFLSGYFGKDKFYGRERLEYFDDGHTAMYEVGMFWGNSTATLRWNRIIGSRLFSNLSLIYSRYGLETYALEEFLGVDFEMRYFSGIRDWGFKHDLTFYPSPGHTMRFGAQGTWHRFNPSAFVLRDELWDESMTIQNFINTYQSALYTENEVRLAGRGVVNAGLRLSHFHHAGTDHLSLEPRVSGSLFLDGRTSLKASYALMNQYVHLLSSTGVGLPTDLWVPATATLPHQRSWQAALGLSRDLPEHHTTLTLEAYYKESDNIITYRDGASFLEVGELEGTDAERSVNWEDNVTSGWGWSYGVELLAHRRAGRFTGWVGYTLSWVRVQFPEKNLGRPYFARHDRRHDVSIVGTYQLSDRITLSATWVYGTGNAITLPVALYPVYEYAHGYSPSIEDFGEINGFRMAPYHRLDLGVQFHRQHRRFTSTLDIGVYNAYSRRNPFFYFIREQSAHADGYYWRRSQLMQVSLFPFIPSISYAISF